ncbi:tripartite tricarboxylate transporter permease, partial [Halovivax sp.]|uniref:tripartite tricarboxylate transporter permease n=1 Tax=Halovivax sp. TaxID=1935978 RepID=UPI0025BBE585
MSFETFVGAIGELLTLNTLWWVFAGVLIGIIVGALPGLGPPLGMAIILPLTLPLAPADAIILLIGVYSGSMYGGSIAAILINTPGVSSSAATMFDGYPMSRQGRAATALSISATASAIAGVFTIGFLILFSPVLIEIVLAVGTPERFLVAILGLAMITVVARGSF